MKFDLKRNVILVVLPDTTVQSVAKRLTKKDLFLFFMTKGYLNYNYENKNGKK
jgi:transposase